MNRCLYFYSALATIAGKSDRFGIKRTLLGFEILGLGSKRAVPSYIRV